MRLPSKFKYLFIRKGISFSMNAKLCTCDRTIKRTLDYQLVSVVAFSNNRFMVIIKQINRETMYSLHVLIEIQLIQMNMSAKLITFIKTV